MANDSKTIQVDAIPNTFSDAAENASNVGTSPWNHPFLTAEVSQYLSTLHGEVDATLDLSTRLPNDSPARLTAAMRYSLLTSGKRFRPILALLAAELCGGKRADVLPVCTALELVHTYSLIHDDLPAMDNDDLRRGAPTCHKQFDEATAILAGDALLTFAFETLATKIADPDVASRLIATLAIASGPCGMVGGQADDVLWSAVTKESPLVSDLLGELTTGLHDDEDGSDARRALLSCFLKRIHRRKTGALIMVSLELGAVAVGANELQLNALRAYGENLGQAFQISDDLLDELGDEAIVGKHVRKDKDAGKLTYVSLYGVEQTQTLLTNVVVSAKEALQNASDVFDVDSISFKAAIRLADFMARRDR
ncbi:MAG: polyprenyl synthetase family protein [Thermoguttaceae bacterium]|nr:polyprenyl synthetase family protein [Thermoguttaceae bacterium]